MVDVSKLDTSTVCLDRKVRFPLGIAPAGLHGLAHEEGELATSRAAAAANVNMIVSSFANHPIGEVVAAGRGGASSNGEESGSISYGQQMYIMRDRELQARVIERAEAAGCKAIYLTGDSPVLGVRYNEWRHDFRTPEGLDWPILERTTEQIRTTKHDTGFMAFNDDSHSWVRDIAWLRGKTKMQIWIKGVLTAEDTELAIQHGCDGILVSNHGGRQLDGVPATIDALIECVDAAKGRIPIHIDGGIRKGTDVFIALALGADYVWVGRPVFWGLAYNGQAGVEKMLDILYEDFRRCMALCGCNSVKDIKRSCLARMGLDGVLRRLE